jgi:hypothetical protein
LVSLSDSGLLQGGVPDIVLLDPLGQVWEGIACDYPAPTGIEFSDDRKIQHMRSCYDKLGLDQRAAEKVPGIKGWVFRKLIDFMVAPGKKGLS